MKLSSEIRQAVSNLTREQMQAIYEAHGFAVYDNETMKSLREALLENIKDGTISPDDVWAYAV